MQVREKKSCTTFPALRVHPTKTKKTHLSLPGSSSAYCWQVQARGKKLLVVNIITLWGVFLMAMLSDGLMAKGHTNAEDRLLAHALHITNRR